MPASPAASPTAPAPRPARVRAFLAAAALVLLGAAVLHPVLAGGWLWDDRHEVVENRILTGPSPLAQIWLAPAGPDYFPLKSTVQALEWRAFGARPAGYHAVSLALHLAGALLAWRLLRRLGAPWAWLGGMLFALHPLAVESVAWAAELKNTLSLPLLLLAAGAWLDWDEGRRPGAYARALLWFLAALLAKSSVVMLPWILLLHAWWRRGRITARDGRAAAPFFAAALALGLVTLHFQRQLAIGGWTIAAGGPGARLARAALALGFYLQKALLPASLSPLYATRVVALSLAHLLPVAALAALAAWCWLRRASWGRHGLLALGFFVLNLLPVIGLIDMSYMRYSWVADHFAYISLVAVTGIVAAALGSWARTTPAGAAAAGAVLVACCAIESNRYARIFHDPTTLWTHALARDPASWAALDNLGDAEKDDGNLAVAIDHYRAALRLKPDLAEARSSLGYALLLSGHPADAVAELREAVRLGYVQAHTNLGNALTETGQFPEAIREQTEALRLEPYSPEVEVNLGNALCQSGRAAESLPHYERAIRLQPDFSEGRYNWGIALAQAGRLGEAADEFGEAAREAPANARIWNHWGAALAQAGRLPEAEARFARAAELAPRDGGAQANLGFVLLQENRPREAIPHLEAAVRLDPGLTAAWRSLTEARRQAALP